ncbi:MAG TPA: radical SAM protein, partial [bacterium]|nr:radical SAM protein [bacterium]
MNREIHKISMGDTCNNACYFCGERSKKHLVDAEHIMREIHRGREQHLDSVIFTGLEPTIFSGFLNVVAAARAAGYSDIAIDTNARMFCYKKFAVEAKNAGLSEARVIVPHHTPKGYERITGATAGLEQMATGIKNLSEMKSVRIIARIPVCEKNQLEIFEIVLFCRKLNIGNISLFAPDGGFSESESIDINAVRGQIEKAASHAVEHEYIFDYSQIDQLAYRDDELMEQTSSSFYPQYYVGRLQRPENLEAVLRPTFACNQICRFCWVSPSEIKPGVADMDKEIARIIKNRIPKLGISG